MELSPGRQRLLFVVVAIALVGLGIFVIEGRSHGTTAASTTPTPTPSASSSAPTTSAAATYTPPATPAPGSTPPSATPPSATPPATTGGGAGGANIYQWLPFTQSDLAAAAKTTLAFANVYANTSYTETRATYAAKLSAVASAQEAATLVSDFETPNIADTRTADKQVSTGTPTIESISSFGADPTSITFDVSIAQQLSSTSGTMNSTLEYNITTVSAGAGWQVNNIQLSNVGNE
jgi:hypothetical protein